MKETKVYVDELPESCDECKYYTQFTDGMGCIVAQELRPMDECDNYMQASCPLQSIKDHDRELVKEVCDEIKNKLGSVEDILINLGNGKEDAFSYFIKILNEVQKEYEK